MLHMHHVLISDEPAVGVRLRVPHSPRWKWYLPSGGCVGCAENATAGKMQKTQAHPDPGATCTQKRAIALDPKPLKALELLAFLVQVFVLMGCVGGLLGAAWIRLNVQMTQLRARHVPASRPMRRLTEVRPYNHRLTKCICTIEKHVSDETSCAHVCTIT